MRLRKNTTLPFSCFALLFAATTATPAAAQESDIADPFGAASPVNAVAASARVDREPEPRDRIAPPNAPTLDQQTRQQLKQLWTLEFDEEAWSDIQADLEAKWRFNILLGQSAKDDSLSVDEPVSVNLRDVPGDYALRMMLAQKNATYCIQAGVIQIISLDDAQDCQYFTRKIFNVTDLLNSMRSWSHAHRKTPPVQDAKLEMSNPTLPGGGSGGPRFRPQTAESAAELELADLICETVQPEGWSKTGSGLATQQWFSGRLVISGPESLIGEVDELITDLRAGLAEQ